MRVRVPSNVGRSVQTRGSNIVALRFGDHGTKEMLGLVSSNVWPVSNFVQQFPTTYNRVSKRTQHVTSSNVGSYWPTMYMSRPFLAPDLCGTRSGTRVVEKDFRAKTFTEGCQSNLRWTNTIDKKLSLIFIVLRSHYDISMFWNSPPRPLERLEEFRWCAFSTATAITSMMNHVFCFMFLISGDFFQWEKTMAMFCL